jgi:hypothetical protein
MTFVTFLKIRSRHCSWWSGCKTPLPHPCLKTPSLWFKTHALAARCLLRCPLPRCGRKLPWVATGQISCDLPPWPPLIIAPSNRCPCVVHPKSQHEVRISCSGLVAGCYSIIIGNDQVTLLFLRPHVEVVKSVKTKPPEIVSLVLPPFQLACGRCRGKALLAEQCLGGSFFPNFKSCCRSSRKLEWCPPHFLSAGVLIAFLST